MPGASDLRWPALLAALCATVGCGAREGPGPAEAPSIDRPVREGQPGRLLLGGTWRFRLDDDGVGVKRRYARQRSLQGWRKVSVPNDFNGAEKKLNRASVGWYRRELRLPRKPAGTRWIVRFEAAGYGTTVFLNGRVVGRHTGNYLPFEVDLRGLRPGRNRLVVRVSSLRRPTDLTHWRRARFHRYGNGPWWNFGGIHREVTIRPARGVDVARAQALPRMACPTCPAHVQVRALVRNLGPRALRPRVTALLDGRSIQLASPVLAPGGRAEAVGDLTIERPRLWDIRRPAGYGLVVRATGGGGGARYRTWFGVRDVRKLGDGRVLLNGRPLHVKGISVHEDDPRVGSAWGPRQRARLLRRIDDLGANLVRAHYPLHPALLEALDRRGVLVWDQAPVNLVQNDNWARPDVRRAAVRVNEQTVLRDRGHPSVIAFSVANELPIPVRRGQIEFMRRAAARVRALDPTRLVALDRVARYGAPDDAHPAFRVFDALGVNEYFGWYRGALPPRPPAYTDKLAPYLDRLHRLQPGAALFLTEFGAEANRPGPAREKGTYAFQAGYLRRHVAAAATRPYLNGSIVWVMSDFRVHSAWSGGNPKPKPPYNQKGIIGADGRPKPGYFEVRRLFRR
ncbi:MAG: glycoside hydrolase family 2 TIM barrel-domain containing protein [Thermoleophilaceae bacterium]